VRFWLPYLWGLESAEYGVLLDLCESAADLHTVGDVRRLTVVEDELLNRPWRWAGGLTLKGYIDYLAGNHPRLGARTLDEMVGRIARVFWQTVERARAARTNQALNDPSEDHWLLYLYPWQAVTYAVEQVLSSP
jgi:hypothetical protein